MHCLRFAAVLAIVAAPTAIAAHSSHPKKPIDPNKKICRQESMTGTIGMHATCHTYAEWQAIDAASGQQSYDNGGASPSATRNHPM